MTDYTIGIDTIEVMVEKMEEFPGWPVYKIKLGTPDDIEIVRELREHTDAVFRVDANCAWAVEETIRERRGPEGAWAWSSSSSRWRPTIGTGMQEVYRRVGPAGDRRRELPDASRRRRLPRPFPRRERQAGQVRRPDAGPADDRTGRGAGPEDDGRLHDRDRPWASRPSPNCCRMLDYVDMDGALLLGRDIATGVTIERGRVRFPEENGCGVRLLERG